MWQSLIDVMIKGGPAAIVLLLVWIVAQARQWVVWGWQYRERVSEVKELKAALTAKDATVQELQRQVAAFLGGGVKDSVS